MRIKREKIYEGTAVIVNQAHPLKEQKVSLCPADDRYAGILLARKAAYLLQECIKACGGRREIVPVSGWRSHTEQQQIWDESMAKSGEAFTRQYVALPGCSEHQTGFAIDLGRAAKQIDFIRPDFPEEGACAAFRRLAAQYGFITRYPRGKEHLTGIAHEPWHFRYIGMPHAMLIEHNGLCLEEYPDFLRQKPRMLSLAHGRTIQVFYVPCPEEQVEINLPEGCCQISGDNISGFFVTAWGCTA